jgi:hypothetical protein
MTIVSVSTHEDERRTLMQLDILSYKLSPAEATPLPEPPATPAPLTPRQQWYDELSDYYLRLMNRFLNAGIAAREAGNPNEELQAMRRYEINRLAKLREEAIDMAEGDL